MAVGGIGRGDAGACETKQRADCARGGEYERGSDGGDRDRDGGFLGCFVCRKYSVSENVGQENQGRTVKGL